jgi:hypothetical protein
MENMNVIWAQYDKVMMKNIGKLNRVNVLKMHKYYGYLSI